MSSPEDPAAAPVAGTSGSSDTGSIKDWLSAVKADEKEKPPTDQEIKSKDMRSYFGKVETTFVRKGKIKQVVCKVSVNLDLHVHLDSRSRFYMLLLAR